MDTASLIMGAAIASAGWIAALPLIKRRSERKAHDNSSD